ncbi:hypothetical protein Pcinc_006443 [Petrolisthes cinctipes]|uniref:Uncharacterized protein n=1 Tax=Petrolisthes cinctipes TaxID=88211 RepID=A0AAE1GHD2_PETCI|nr:hypothetical protein Pcinc_006443 [Petrolisthes cinctipes]
MAAAKWCFVGALLCVLVWVSVDPIEWHVSQEVIRRFVSPLMTGKCPHQQRSFDIETVLHNPIIWELITGQPDPATNKTESPPDLSLMDGLKAMVHVHPFTWKGEENGKQVYKEDGVIQAQVVIAHGRLFYSLNTSLYTAGETQGEWSFFDYYDQFVMVANILGDLPINKPVPIKLLIDTALEKLSSGDNPNPHMEVLLQKNYTTLLDLPAIRVSTTNYTFPPLPELSFTYDSSGPTAAGGITVDQYWTGDLFRMDVLCNFLNENQMYIIDMAELYNFILSPLDSDPHPLVAAKLSVPAGRALTLDLHPIFGVPMGGRLDLQINMNITDQFSHQTPRQMTVPLIRNRVTVEALPTYLHQLLQIVITVHLIFKMVLISIFLVFLVTGLFHHFKYRHHEKYSVPTSSLPV